MRILPPADAEWPPRHGTQLPPLGPDFTMQIFGVERTALPPDPSAEPTVADDEEVRVDDDTWLERRQKALTPRSGAARLCSGRGRGPTGS